MTKASTTSYESPSASLTPIGAGCPRKNRQRARRVSTVQTFEKAGGNLRTHASTIRLVREREKEYARKYTETLPEDVQKERKEFWAKQQEL